MKTPLSCQIESQIEGYKTIFMQMCLTVVSKWKQGKLSKKDREFIEHSGYMAAAMGYTEEFGAYFAVRFKDMLSKPPPGTRKRTVYVFDARVPELQAQGMSIRDIVRETGISKANVTRMLNECRLKC